MQAFCYFLHFAKMFLYLNGIAFVLQLTIGITSKRGLFVLPIWNINDRYIWFPILTYVIFFLVSVLILDNKKREEENGENSHK